MAKAQANTTDAPSNTSNNPTNKPGDWDEARLQGALARIQEMHIQLRNLRETVPSLLRPIHAEHPSPETLYNEFRSAATNAVTNVRGFQGKMRDPKTKEILGRAEESREQTSDGIESWLVSQQSDWLDQPALRSANDLQGEEEQKNGEQGESKERPTVAQTVDTFKAVHPETTITLQKEKRNINVVIPSPGKLQFNISWEDQADPQAPQTFKVVSKGGSRMHATMNAFLAKRARQEDLPWTLEMCLSYSDIRTRRCDQPGCKKLMNFANEFTVVREGKEIKLEDGSRKTEWKAYHPTCNP